MEGGGRKGERERLGWEEINKEILRSKEKRKWEMREGEGKKRERIGRGKLRGWNGGWRSKRWRKIKTVKWGRKKWRSKDGKGKSKEKNVITKENIREGEGDIKRNK